MLASLHLVPPVGRDLHSLARLSISRRQFYHFTAGGSGGFSLDRCGRTATRGDM
jgi:hypothetical protein